MAKKRTRKPEPPAWGPRLIAWLDRHALKLVLVCVAIASLRIVATYLVLSHTADEIGHLAVGMEFLDKKVYEYEHQHPPLARALIALFPYLAGVRSYHLEDKYEEGLAILCRSHRYQTVLSLARLGILPFFWLACFVVYVWSKRCFGNATAAVAVFLLTLLPPVLAHAGLATTDMALAACLGAAFLALLIWAERPSALNSVVFGGAVGLAVLVKFSMFAFYPLVVALALAWYLLSERPGVKRVVSLARRRILPLSLAVCAGALLIWAGYRFSVGKVPSTGAWAPAPELFHGIQVVMAHNKLGHDAYLLGESSRTGWWYYYPVVLAVKTPLPFLLLLFYGAAICCARGKETSFRFPLAFALGLLLAGLISRINIGVRHILPIYLGFSILAAIGVLRLLERPGRSAWAAGALLVWLILTGALKHPDYLAYFNELAASEPEKILVDSDLDWGQDMNRLSRRLRELGAREVYFQPFVQAYLEECHGFPPVKPFNPFTRLPGWHAVSPTVWKVRRFGLYNARPEARFWVDEEKPFERVGAVLLYYFAPAQQ